MGRRCVVPGCSIKSSKGIERVTVHAFRLSHGKKGESNSWASILKLNSSDPKVLLTFFEAVNSRNVNLMLHKF